ncbi:MAG: M56 family metallopeptidase [Verrucomicrobiota bacterium]
MPTISAITGFNEALFGLVIGVWWITFPVLALAVCGRVFSLLPSRHKRLLWVFSLGLPTVLMSAYFLAPQLFAWAKHAPMGCVLQIPSFASGLWHLLGFVYLTGVALLFGRILLGWFQLWRWSASAEAISNPRLINAFAVAKSAYDIRSPFYLLAGESVPAPITVGVLNHRILLPASLERELNDEELRDLALHEAAHIKRADPVVFAAASVIRAVFWPNPLVWLATYELKLAAEKAADESVISITEEVSPYTQLLVKMAESLVPRSFVSLAAGINLGKSSFLLRVESLLGSTLVGKGPNIPLVAGAWSVFILSFVVPVVFHPVLSVEAHTASPEEVVQATYEYKLPPRYNRIIDELLPFAGEPRSLELLELANPIRIVVADHWYSPNEQKLSFFTFEDANGKRLTAVLDRGQEPYSMPQQGDWFLVDGEFDRDQLNPVPLNSELDYAVMDLMEGWATARMSPQAWRSLLEEWPQVSMDSVELGALFVGESLDACRNFRRYYR